MSLYLNLKLINQNYYEDSSILPIMSEVSLNIYIIILRNMVELQTVKTLICRNTSILLLMLKMYPIFFTLQHFDLSMFCNKSQCKVKIIKIENIKNYKINHFM